MRYCFDIDGTICFTPQKQGKPDYRNSSPIPFMVKEVNRLFKEGNYIIFHTARGKNSGIDWSELTRSQLNEWGFNYNELTDMFQKPNADIFIDDKGINVEEWKRKIPLVKGIIAGAFDLIHPGYIKMFKEAKNHCNNLTIALHDDPSLERLNKLSPVQSIEERKEILYSIKYIDNIIEYKYENSFLEYLKNYDIRFLGEDYKIGNYTGKDIPIKIIWIKREHDYSTTALKRKIYNSLNKNIL